MEQEPPNNEEEKEYIVATLVSLNLKRNIAIALTHLLIFDEATVFDFTRETGLRQPEVSVAMKELKNRDWVKERKIKKPGRGSPYNRYYIIASFADILNQLQKNQNKKKIVESQKMLKRLKELK